MSSKRARHQEKLRRRLRSKEALAAAYSAELEYVGASGAYEVWRRGEIVFNVLAASEQDSPVRADALETRKRATLDGSCPRCGASATITGAHDVSITHEADCPAGDTVLERAVTDWRAVTIGVATSATYALHPGDNLGPVPDPALRERGYRLWKVVTVR